MDERSRIRDNVERSRFELEVDGRTAFANYRRQGPTLVIDYVEAPPALRGTGAAGRLMQGIVQMAEAEGLRIMPLCGYAAGWIRQNERRRARSA